MRNTTLCYIENSGKVLMLHRTKKENDENAGKWIGVGGKFEEGESPEECLCREVKEETGLDLTSYTLRGIITFTSNIFGSEYMFLYRATTDSFEVRECSEGELLWVDREKIESLPTWEGDALFLPLVFGSDDFFTMKLVYEGDTLVFAEKDGKVLKG